jgi:transposase-like protein
VANATIITTAKIIAYSVLVGLSAASLKFFVFIVLSRQGKSIRDIARMLKVSRNTVRRYIRGEGPPRCEA